MAVADVAHARLDCPESLVPDCYPNMMEHVVNDDYCLSFAGDVAVSGRLWSFLRGMLLWWWPCPPLLGYCPRPFLLMRLLWPMLGWSLSESLSFRMLGANSQPTLLGLVATMRVASLAYVGEVVLGVTDLAVAGAVPLADAGGMFPAVFPGQVAAGAPVQTDDVPVNVVGIQTCAAWGDWFSPGVWCRDKTLGWQNFDFRTAGSMCSGWVHSPGSVAVGASAPLLCDLECPVTEDMTY